MGIPLALGTRIGVIKRFGVVARADQHAIRIGKNTDIGDNTTINCNLTRLPTGIPHSVNIGDFIDFYTKI